MPFDPLAAIVAATLALYIYAVLVNRETLAERLAGDTRRSYLQHFLDNCLRRAG